MITSSLRRVRRLRNWFGDVRFHFIAFDPLRNDGFSPHIWLCAANRGDDVNLDDGQTWSDLPRSGRLCARHAGNLWTRRDRFDCAFGSVSLERESRLQTTSNRLFEAIV